MFRLLLLRSEARRWSVPFSPVAYRMVTTTSTPKALGGSENEGASLTITSTAASTAGALEGASSSRHVSPTNTVAKRVAYPFPEPTPDPASFVGAHLDSILKGAASHHQQHQKRLMKRFA